MSDKSRPIKQSDGVSSVNLKRTINLQAVVTENFKRYLMFELSEQTRLLDDRYRDIEKKASVLIQEAKEKGDDRAVEMVQGQLANERNQYHLSKSEIVGRSEQAKNLAIDSYFMQGTIEGFVTVKEGDNLYEKLGGMTITVKDGIVEKIDPIGVRPPSQLSAS